MARKKARGPRLRFQWWEGSGGHPQRLYVAGLEGLGDAAVWLQKDPPNGIALRGRGLPADADLRHLRDQAVAALDLKGWSQVVVAARRAAREQAERMQDLLHRSAAPGGVGEHDLSTLERGEMGLVARAGLVGTVGGRWVATAAALQAATPQAAPDPDTESTNEGPPPGRSPGSR